MKLIECKRRASVRLIGLLIGMLTANMALAHGVTLKVQHAFAEDSPFQTQFFAPWVKQLDEATHGRLRFQLIPSAAAAESTALLDQVQQGAIDIGYVVIALSGRFPRFEQFVAPTGDRAAASRALWEYVRANDLAKQEFKGLKLLAVGVTANMDSAVLIMNPAAFKSLSDDLKQEIEKNSGVETSAQLGRVHDTPGN